MQPTSKSNDVADVGATGGGVEQSIAGLQKQVADLHEKLVRVTSKYERIKHYRVLNSINHNALYDAGLTPRWTVPDGTPAEIRRGRHLVHREVEIRREAAAAVADNNNDG